MERHRAAALGLLRRTFSGLRSQHDDIWQELATALFVRSKERGFWPDELRNYLLGAVAKNAANRLRTAAIQNTHAGDPQSGELARLAAAPVEDQVLGELDAENYRSIIRSLSPRQRAVAVAERDVHQGGPSQAAVARASTGAPQSAERHGTTRSRTGGEPASDRLLAVTGHSEAARSRSRNGSGDSAATADDQQCRGALLLLVGDSAGRCILRGA